MPNLPHFIHIGYPKTASTWLHDLFIQHPEICFMRKPKFFQYEDCFTKGREFYQDLFKIKEGHKVLGDGDETYSMGEHFKSFGWDCCYRAADSPASWSKEASSARLPGDRELIAQRIHQAVPNAKIIIVIRNQADWLISLYKHKVKKGMPLSFRKFLDSKTGKEIIAAGFYSSAIDLYFKLFGKENVLVLRYEQLRDNPTAFLDEISNFLGVSKFNYSQADKKIKVGMTNRAIKIKQRINYINRFGLFHKWLRRLVQYADRGWFLKLKDVKLVSEEDKEYLADLYDQDNKKLTKLLIN